jgi:uncharacterized protein (TIGR02145 family)
MATFDRMRLFLFCVMFLICSILQAQLKEFSVSELPRPEVAVVQANTKFNDDALLLVYTTIENLEFRSSLGGIDKVSYNSTASRYEVLVKPKKQMIFVAKAGFIENKVSTLNPNPKEVLYFKVEEKNTFDFNKLNPGKLSINSNPTGASISLNGIPVATKTPFTGELNPGPTRIQLNKAKYQTLDTIMNVQSSTEEVLTINLKPSTLWLNITSNPTSAQVRLDGIIIGTTPLSKELDLTDKSKQGTHSLKITLPEYIEQSQTIQVYPSKDPVAISVDLKKTEGAFIIQSTPEGAEVFIDGAYKGITPLQGVMPVGKYRVELKMEDYSPSAKKEIIVNSQTTVNLKENLIFKKQPLDNLEDDLVEGELLIDASGDSYKTVKIGDQIWMAENLNTDRFQNGDLIPEVKNDNVWISAGKSKQAAWCYYDNNPINGEKYGKLYNWYAVADPRGLCPTSWHVPSDNEWTKLTEHLGGNLLAGGKMKSESGWSENSVGINNSGFNGLPGGARYLSGNGAFYDFGSYFYCWSSTVVSASSAWYLYLYNSGGDASVGNYTKRGGLSIRCIKDQ